MNDAKMVFTDENLKRLKEYPYGHDIHMLDGGVFDLKALLARLAAAESCIDDHRGDCLADMGKPCTCGYQAKLDKWLRACGKGE